MSRPARNILHFPRRKPRIAVGCHADHNPAHLAFLRQHTGDAPEPLPLRYSWVQIAMRGIAIACMVYALLALWGSML